MTRLARAAIAAIAAIAALTPVLALSTSASAGSGSVSYTASQSFTPPSSAFSGTTGGGDGWAIANYDGRIFNVFHHQTYLGLMCHNQSDASACWNTTDTGTGNLYKTITAQVGGVTATFATSGKVGLYVDPSTGYLYVYAVRDDSGYRQPGVVCVNLNGTDTSTDPVCSGTGGQPPAWTPLAANGDTNWTSGNTAGGTVTPTFYGGNLYAWNPVLGTAASPGAGGATGNGDNALLCYSLAAQAACAGEPFAVPVTTSSGGADNDNSFPTPSSTLIGSQMFIPVNWSTGGVLACVDLSGATPAGCSGAWPQPMSVTTNSPTSIAIPSLDAAGNTTGVCGMNASSTWNCFGLDGSVEATPTGLTASSLQTWQWAGAPVVVGTRVLDVQTTQAYCYDFATNAACTTSSGHFPIALANLGNAYTLNSDPQRPTCLWVNADSGTSQIQNFDALTGGSCASAPVRLYASSFVAPYQACTPTSFTSISLLSGGYVTSPAPTLSFTNANGVVIDGPYAFDVSGANPTLDLTALTYTTPIDLSTQSALPQFVLNLTAGSGGLGTVDVQVSWSGSDLNQCTPGYTGPAPSTSPATAIADASAQLNGTVDNTSSDTVSGVQFCYSTTSFTSGHCTGTSVPATAGTAAGTTTPFSANPSGLSPSTTYFYELEATDATTSSPLYGGVESFATGPTATTGPVSSLRDTSVTLNGSLYNPAGDAIGATTFCYATSSFAAGACAGTTVAAVAGAASASGQSYSLPVSALAAGSTYYYEFIAQDTTTSSAVLGAVRSFVAAPVTATGSASGIGDTAATLNGTVYNPTGDSLTTRFCYAPTAFASGSCAATAGSTTVSATAGSLIAGTTSYSAPLASLSPGTTYHFELVVDDLTTVQTLFGGVHQFTTGPIATTLSALSVGPTSATLVGSLYNPGGDTLGAVQFCYQTTSFTSGGCTGTVSTGTPGTASGSTTPYTFPATGLSAGATYYYEFSVADTTTGATVLGGVTSFTTGPVATTLAPTSVGDTGATAEGTLANPNALVFSQVDFCYQTTTFSSGGCSGTTVVAVAGSVNGSTTGFSADLTGLQPATAYDVELVATSGATSYFGGVTQFTTHSIPPTGSGGGSSGGATGGGSSGGGTGGSGGTGGNPTGPTTLVARWPSATTAGESRPPTYVVTLSPGGRRCETTRTTCRFTGLAPGRHYTYRVDVAIEIVPFAENSSQIAGGLVAQARALVDLVRRFHPSSVVLAGYTDAFGSLGYNARLSDRRTRAVGRYVTRALRALGVRLPRIIYRAFGKSHPVVSNASIAAAAGNRRVEVSFVLP